MSKTFFQLADMLPPEERAMTIEAMAGSIQLELMRDMRPPRNVPPPTLQARLDADAETLNEIGVTHSRLLKAMEDVAIDMITRLPVEMRPYFDLGNIAASIVKTDAVEAIKARKEAAEDEIEQKRMDEQDAI